MISSVTNGMAGIGLVAPRASGAASPAFGAVLAEATSPTSAKKAQPERVETLPGDAARLNDAIAAFHKEAALTPAQRVRREVLKSLNLTEEALAALPPAERLAKEQKIAAEVARRLRLGANGKADPNSAAQATDPAALSV